MAELYLAKQAGLEGFEKLVVVKKILPHMSGEQDFVKMFVNEARVAARLNHPNIVQIYDLGKVDDSYFIAMEYIHGEDLRSIAKQIDMKHARIPIEHTCKILADACAALHYAHTRTDGSGQPLGLVHRDVSPQNIILTYDGNVKLVDFGIAKATAVAAETVAGLLKGKYAYMSPEQCRGQKIDARTDVWAIGVLLWEFLCWKRLFKRDAEFATLRAVVEEPIPPPREVRKEIPIDIDRVCTRALERNLEKRYPTAQAMQEDLEAAIRRHNWKTGSIGLAKWMGELFADKLREQQEAVKAANVANIEEFLLRVDEQTKVGWMESVSKTPSTQVDGPPGTGAGGSDSARGEMMSGREPSSSVRRPLFTAPLPKIRRGPSRFATVATAAGITLAVGVAVVYYRGGTGASPAAQVVPAVPQVATLKMTVDPPDANVFLDGKRTAGKSPFTIDQVSINGPHRVLILKDGHKDFTAEIADLKPGETRELIYKLEPGN
jgi:serine/threonine-protein kinase